MKRVLVTGGTGILGREVVERLADKGYTVRVLSRRDASANLWPGRVEWVRAELGEGDSLDAAVADVDAIVHAATNPFKTKKVDIEGTKRLLDAARAAGVGHVVYISIVGIERIPYYYYKAKLAGEQLMRDSGVPWTVLRATQFHTLLDMALKPYARLPFGFLPTDFRFQPIDPREVAVRLCECVEAGPGGRVSDIGGPQMRAAGDLAAAWLRARRLRCRLIRLPLPGRIAAGFRKGLNTCPDKKYGAITWEEWLRETYGRDAAVQAKAEPEIQGER